MHLDDISKRLIELLQDDGRMAYATLAQEVGLSEAAVRHRVLKLRDEGVMQIVAVTDPLKLGFGREAMIGINVTSDVREVAAEIAKIEEIDYVMITSGRFDIMAELVAASDDELLDIVSGQVRAISGVGSIETFVYLRLVKQTYSWGVR